MYRSLAANKIKCFTRVTEDAILTARTVTQARNYEADIVDNKQLISSLGPRSIVIVDVSSN